MVSLPVREQKPLGEVLEFMRRMWALHHGLQSTSKRMGAKVGVTGPQRLVIRLLGRSPGMTPGQLAEILHVHPSTLTGVLKRLEARGYLVRRADADDRRRSLLTLTPAGRRLDAAHADTVESIVKRMLKRLPEADIDATCRTLLSLARELGGDNAPLED